MITLFQATHEKMHLFKFKGETDKEETFKSRIGYLINSSWIYSYHWKNENYQWIEQAKRDLSIELEYAQERLAKLKEANRLLNLIEEVEQT